MHGIFFEPPIETNFIGHIFAEIYKDRVYAPFVEGKNLGTILDVGANIGLTSYYFAQHAKEVIAVEPDLEHFDCLMKMVEHNKLVNIKPVNKAVYIKSGKFPLFRPEGNRTMNSLHQGVVANHQDPKFQSVETVTLPQLFSDLSIKEVDLFKCDIEGTEYELFCSTSFKEVADKIKMVITEVHQWADRNPQQLIDGFKNAGFINVERLKSDANIMIASK